MAGLEAAYNAMMVGSEIKPPKKKSRLVADPGMTVQELSDVYALHSAWKGNKNMYELVCPSEAGPRVLGWGTKPHPAFMQKLAGLVFDLVKISPNTKIASSKNIAAIQKLVENGILVNNLKDINNNSFAMKVDQIVRIALAMFRVVKQKDEEYQKIMKMVDKKDKGKIDLVLQRIKLPQAEHFEPDEEEQSPEPAYQASQVLHSPKSPSIPSSWGRLPSEDWACGWEDGKSVLQFPSATLTESASTTLTTTCASTTVQEGGGFAALGFPTGLLKQNRNQSLALVPAPAPKKCLTLSKKEQEEEEQMMLKAAAGFVPKETKTPAKAQPKTKEMPSTSKKVVKSVSPMVSSFLCLG